MKLLFAFLVSSAAFASPQKLPCKSIMNHAIGGFIGLRQGHVETLLKTKLLSHIEEQAYLPPNVIEIIPVTARVPRTMLVKNENEDYPPGMTAHQFVKFYPHVANDSYGAYESASKRARAQEAQAFTLNYFNQELTTENFNKVASVTFLVNGEEKLSKANRNELRAILTKQYGAFFHPDDMHDQVNEVEEFRNDLAREFDITEPQWQLYRMKVMTNALSHSGFVVALKTTVFRKYPSVYVDPSTVEIVVPPEGFPLEDIVSIYPVEKGDEAFYRQLKEK